MIELTDHQPFPRASKDSEDGNLFFATDAMSGKQWVVRNVEQSPWGIINTANPALGYYEAWQRCRAADMNVAPELVIIDPYTIAVPNLIAQGIYTYGKYRARALSRGISVWRETVLDNRFCALTEPQMTNHLKLQADKATSAGILLPTDDPMELALTLTDEIYPITLDLEQIEFTTSYRKLYIHNTNAISEALTHMFKIQSALMYPRR